MDAAPFGGGRVRGRGAAWVQCSQDHQRRHPRPAALRGAVRHAHGTTIIISAAGQRWIHTTTGQRWINTTTGQ
eukprot:6041131-Pyramimonas_sp.AAC.1